MKINKIGRINIKTLVSAFLAALIITALMGTVSFADESGSCGGGLKWNYSGGTLYITGSGDMTDFDDSNLPPWFNLRGEIVHLSLADGITHIGNMAFFQCPDLISVYMPDSVVSIGEYAFAECSQVRSVWFSDNLTSISEGGFSECLSLAAVQFPSVLKEIGNKAFFRCKTLASVTIPSSVERLGVQTFAYCEGLIRATVNANIETLSTWTFYGCKNLKSVSLSPSIKNTGTGAFKGCESLGAVYTQTGDDSVADVLEQQISQDNPSFSENGYVASYEQPDATVSVFEGADADGVNPSGVSVDDIDVTEVYGDGVDASGLTVGNAVSVVQVYEGEGADVTVTDTTYTLYGEDEQPSDPNVGKPVRNVSVFASISGEGGFDYVAGRVNDLSASSDGDETVSVVIQLNGTTIKAEELLKFVGKKISLTLITSTGVRWLIDVTDIKPTELSGTYELDVTTLFAENGAAEKLNAEKAYVMTFAGDVNFPATVGVLLPGTALDSAALFLDASSSSLIKVRVDNEHIAWFPFESTKSGAVYTIGINVLDTAADEVVIPRSLFAMYNENYSGLMDSSGKVYTVGNRSSSFGITGKQFALYVAVGILAIILVVSVVMITRNHLQKVRINAKKTADEKQREKDDLREKIMRDMIEEAKEREKAEDDTPANDPGKGKNKNNKRHK